MKIYRLDRMLCVAAIRNMYSDSERASTGRIISTDSQKAIIEEVYRSGVTAMKCQRQDASIQWRSEKFGKLQNLSDEIKDSEAGIEEATYR
jgi:hypothetical protein